MTTYEVITEENRALEAIEEIKAYLLAVDKPKLALDLETFSDYGLFPKPIRLPNGDWEGKPRFMQIGLNPKHVDKQYLFDVPTLGWEFIGKNFKFLENTMIIGQNLQYDWGFLYMQFGIYLHKMLDTLLISQVLFAGDMKKHGLGTLYKKFLDYNWFQSETEMTFAQYEYFKEKLQLSDWKGEITEEQLKYAAEDVKLIFYLYEAQKQDLDDFVAKEGKRGIYDVIKLECDLIPIFAFMEINGVDFDIENHKQVIKYLEDTQLEFSKKIATYFFRKVKKSNGLRGKKRVVWEELEAINLNSSQQVAQALLPFIPELPKTDKGNYSVKSDVLVYFKDRHETVSLILSYRRLETALNFYGQKLIDLCHADGRIHPSWYQIGSSGKSVDTGRVSCSKPNLMNQPSRGMLGSKQAASLMRSSYVSREGYSFVDADISNQEVRIMAEITKDKFLIDALNSGVDLHLLTAKEIFDLNQLPDLTTEAGKTQRKLGKQIRLSLQYLMGTTKFQSDMYIETDGEEDWEWDKAYEMREKFLEIHSGIKAAQDKLKTKLESVFAPHPSLASFRMGKGPRKPIYISYTLMGRPRRYCLTDKQEDLARDPETAKTLHRDYEVESKNGKWGTFGNQYSSRLHGILREAFNAPVQGSGADLVKVAMLAIHKKFREAGFDDSETIVMQVHDQIVAQVKDEHVDIAKEIVYYEIMSAVKRFVKKVPSVVEIKIVKKWSDAKD